MSTRMQDLRESNEFLNLLLSNINSAVLIVDENLQIHQFNDFSSYPSGLFIRGFYLFPGIFTLIGSSNYIFYTSQLFTENA